jgi:hypothetical protein
LQHFCLQQPLLQPLLQPQLGAAAQVGAAAAQAGAPQPLLQPLLQPLQQPRSRQRSPQHLRWPRMPQRFNPQQRFLQQLLPQPLLQQAWPAPHDGSAPHAGPEGAAHVGPAGAAHVGAGAAQAGAGAAQAGAPQLGLAAVQQLVWQPQPLAPSIRSSRSKPKLWVQSPKPSTIVPKIMFHFI